MYYGRKKQKGQGRKQATSNNQFDRQPKRLSRIVEAILVRLLVEWAPKGEQFLLVELGATNFW